MVIVYLFIFGQDWVCCCTGLPAARIPIDCLRRVQPTQTIQMVKVINQPCLLEYWYCYLYI